MSSAYPPAESGPPERKFIVFRSPQEKTDPNRDTKGVNVLPIAQAQHFDVHAPITNHVYVCHPADPRRLYLFSEYDEKVLVDIFNEGLRITQSLGACHVESWTSRTSGKEGGARVKSPLAKPPGVVVSADMNFERSKDWEVVFTTTGQGAPPMDPRPLRFPDYPGFDATCESVLRNGASKSQLTIQQQAKFLLSGEIAATLKGAGFKLGTSAESIRQSVYVIRAEYPKRAEGTPRGLLGRSNRSS